MDAEIRTHQALHEAKPSECPKGIGIINQKFISKTDFFYNLLRAVKISPYFLHFFTFSWTKRASVVYYI